jgi:hypothetical protein
MSRSTRLLALVALAGLIAVGALLFPEFRAALVIAALVTLGLTALVAGPGL